MHLAIIFRVLGILMMLFSITLIPPAIISIIQDDGAIRAFVVSQLIIFGAGLLIWLPVYNHRKDLRTRDGFLITALFWTVLGVAGSLPFILGSTKMSVTDAVFESISGLTTTGATVIVGLDALPMSILFYRQQLQWLGGIGIIVIAVAILPMLGIGGMQLYRAETPGPVKDSKLTPRITQTAKVLFFIYVSLTFVCAVSYWLAGMEWFDAVGHAFSTIAIGGFSTHDASIGYFDNALIMIIAIVFMILSGINFALHFISWRSRNILQYLRDPECQFYFWCLLLGSAITVSYLYFFNHIDSFSDSLLLGTFELVSILTTTGFGVADYSQWPTFLPFMLFMFAFMGGCGGSTAGGMKVMRVMLITKQGIREIYRLIHPNAIIPIKVGNKVVSDRIVEAVWGFFAVYVISFIIMFLILLSTGLDFITAFSAIGACINNLGPGMGDVAEHYGAINTSAKWVLCFAMLLGRLEVFTLLVLLTPSFWKS